MNLSRELYNNFSRFCEDMLFIAYTLTIHRKNTPIFPFFAIKLILKYHFDDILFIASTLMINHQSIPSLPFFAWKLISKNRKFQTHISRELYNNFSRFFENILLIYSTWIIHHQSIQIFPFSAIIFFKTPLEIIGSRDIYNNFFYIYIICCVCFK